jgi:hypothetical protein
VLRRIFRSNRDEVTKGWRKIRNVELRNLNCSPRMVKMMKSTRMGSAGHVAIMEKRNACRILVRNPEGKRPLGRPRREWIILR